MPDLDRFRRDVKAAFPDAVDFSATLSAKGNFNKTGPLHLPAPTGKRMVEEVLGAHGLCGYGPSRR